MAKSTKTVIEEAFRNVGIFTGAITSRLKQHGEVDFDLSGQNKLSDVLKIAEVLGTQDITWTGRTSGEGHQAEDECMYTATGIDGDALRARLLETKG